MPWINPNEDLSRKEELPEYIEDQENTRIPSDGFDSWLTSVGEKFRNLSAEDRNKTLDFLISMSDGSQLFHLSKQLGSFLKRDFLSLLPQELAFYLVRFVNVETLKKCCLVSNSWNSIVNSCSQVWKIACIHVGVNLIEESCQSSQDFKNVYLAAERRLQLLRDGVAFSSSVMYGHTERIMAVYYKDGILATGSDDFTVRIWDCALGDCIRVLRTHQTVSDIKFDETSLVTASFNTTATLWDIETGEQLKTYVGHVAAIFSVDYDTRLDVLVTGSADSTVKVWKLSTGVMIQTLPQHRSAWITHVKLYSDVENKMYSILSRDDTSLHVWRLSQKHDILELKEWQHSNVPGLQMEGSKVSFITVEETSAYTLVTGDIRSMEHVTKRALNELPPSSFIQGYLGSGNQFSVLLIEDEYPKISIIRHHREELLGSVPMPNTFRRSKRGSTFTLGDRSWLSGFTRDNGAGVVFVTSLPDNGIYLIRWRQVRQTPDVS